MNASAVPAQATKATIRLERDGDDRVFHVPPMLFRHPAWPEFEIDANGPALRLDPKIKVRWLAEAEECDPLNQIERLIVTFGDSLTMTISFAPTGDFPRPAVDMAFEAVMAAMLDPKLSGEIRTALERG